VKLDATVSFRDESKQISLDTKACTLPDGTSVVCTELKACLEYSGVGVDRVLGQYIHCSHYCIFASHMLWLRLTRMYNAEGKLQHWMNE
jgi:hypothetical protein